jgi:1-acyl-sn-glycerol-3-phosphate acyltransferase
VSGSASGSGGSRRSRPSWGFRLVARIAIVLVGLARWRITTTGLEHVPRTGGAVVTWNHTGHADFVTTIWPIYRVLGRTARILAKRELWRSVTTRWVVRAVDAVPVDRSRDGDRRAPFAAAVEALDAGDLVVVAPEGTISPSFELLPFRSGAVRMAQQAGVPIVPSVTWGSHRMVTYGHGFSLRRAFFLPVSVRFGPPIDVGPDDDVAEATARVRAAMHTLLDEVQRDYPDGTPAGAWWVPARLGGGAPPPDEPDEPNERPDREPGTNEPTPSAPTPTDDESDPRER